MRATLQAREDRAVDGLGVLGPAEDHAAARAAQPAFREYAKRVVANARALAEALMARGFDVVSGGTDNHLILIDLTSKKVSGKIAAKALDKAGIELNYNSVPYDTRKPFDPSGIRLGSPAISSRGMGEAEMKQIAAWMDRVVADPSEETAAKVLGEVREVTRKFPAPGISI